MPLSKSGDKLHVIKLPGDDGTFTRAIMRSDYKPECARFIRRCS
eukprot:COSAG02_NODE_48916_length_330_cov_1.125541_1_plen_43_part_10